MNIVASVLTPKKWCETFEISSIYKKNKCQGFLLLDKIGYEMDVPNKKATFYLNILGYPWTY